MRHNFFRKCLHLIVATFIVALLVYYGLMFAVVVPAFVVGLDLRIKMLEGHFGQLVGFNNGGLGMVNPDSGKGVHGREGYKNAFLYDTLFFVKFTGKIIHGAGRGKGLGFPTLNLDVLPDLEQGVYACWVWLGGTRYRGAANYGTRPTFGETKPVFEVFVLDFSGEVYDEEVTVEVLQKIRGIKKFDSAEALKKAMVEDVQAVRQVCDA